MAYIESAVVVYLRALYHPEGFLFPLKPLNDAKIIVEVFREAATLVLLVAVAALAGKKLRERFAYFMIAFGIWDIFYYVWLKVILDWPSSLFEWDVLFLIPMTWIGPVIAPLSIAMLMVIFGVLIIYFSEKGMDLNSTISSTLLVLAGTGIILYSFMSDTGATIELKMPQPYRYDLLVIGNVLFIISFLISFLKAKRSNS